MKFDVVRAWKDEAYRESLSEEQLSLLPANPAGEFELTDAEMEIVYGGGGGPLAGPAAGPVPLGGPVAGPACGAGGCVGGGAIVGSSHIHSFAVLCDISVFSVNVNVIAQLINILSPNHNVCVESH